MGADGKLHWRDGEVWVRKGSAEKVRLEREAKERVSEREAYLKVTAGFAQCQCGAWNAPTSDRPCTQCGGYVKRKEFYVGKPDMPSSSEGGGWGGPKEGHDKDERFLCRGESRELPEWLYKGWTE